MVILILLLLLNNLQAKDFGVEGKTFSIQEEDAVVMFERKARDFVQTSKWELFKQKFIKRVKKRINRPVSVAGITKAAQTRIFYYDPSITVPYDLKDQLGNVFQRAGTTVNPLQISPFKEHMIFIDGDDDSQVAWLKEIYLSDSKRKQMAKVVLVNGSPFELMELLSHKIYFDQQGLITKKLRIKHVPAVVYQEGDRLQITEFNIAGLSQ